MTSEPDAAGRSPHHRGSGDLTPTTDEPGSERALRSLGERPGDTIGPYRILETIGEGGFGIVYVADQREPVRRRVALKVVKAGMDTKEVIARFEAERQALAMMDHPNVATVFDAGVTDKGRPYFAMEHVPGLPITDYCDTAKLRTRDRLELFIQVCQAVQHAHQKGIIHRDLKPSNILVTLFDGRPVPKVIDFGIAKATNAQLTQRTLYTETGRLMGTPEYMSPEQAGTSGLDVDTRTDIYSLGVIFYQLLTGTLPFDPKTLRQAGSEGIARIIKEMEPPKPSTRLSTIFTDKAARGGASTPTDLAKTHGADIKALASELRGDLDWITLKAIEKERSRRYETANAMALDVRRFLNGEMVLARPPSMTYRFSKFARRHKGAVAAGVAVFGALAVGTVVAGIGWIEARAANASLKVALEDTKAARVAEAEKRKEAEDARAAVEEQRLAAESARARAEANGYVAAITAAQAELREFRTGAAQKRLDAVPESLREWEWHYLRAECDTAADTVLSFGEKETFYNVSLSSDGTLIASQPLPKKLPARNSAEARAPGADITVREVKTGQVVRVLAYPSVPLFRTAFSPDNRLLTAYEQTGAASRVWDLSTGQQLLPEKLQSGTALLGFDPSSKLAAVAFRVGYTGDGPATTKETTRLLRIDNWEPVCTLDAPDGKTWSQRAVFSPDGKWIALCQGSGFPFCIFDAATGAVVKQLDTGWAYCAAFSKSGKFVAATFNDGNRKVPRAWDTTTWKEAAAIKSEGVEFIAAIDFVELEGRTLLVTAGQQGAVRFWSPLQGYEDGTWRSGPGSSGYPESIASMAMTPDRWLVAATPGGKVRRWDLTRPLVKDASGGVTLVPSPDGSTVAVGVRGTPDSPATVLLRRASDLADVGTLCCASTETGSDHTAYGLDYSPDGRTLLAVHSSFAMAGSVKLKTFDLATRRWGTPPGAGSEPVHNGWVGWTRYSPDGRFFATSSGDKTARLWSAQTMQRVAELAGHTDQLLELAFSPDGKTLATCSVDATIRLWSLETFKPRRTLTGHDKGVSSVLFTADGRRLVSASLDGSVRLWNVETGECEQTIAELGAAINRMVMNHAGTRLVLMPVDSTVHIVETDSWQEMACLRTRFLTRDLQFSRDDRTLMLLYEGGGIEQWCGTPESQLSPVRRAFYDADRQAKVLVDRLAPPGADTAASRERLKVDTSIPEPVKRAAFQALDRLDGQAMKGAYTIAKNIGLATVQRVLLMRGEPTQRGAWDPAAAKAQVFTELRADPGIGPVELEAAIDSAGTRLDSIASKDNDGSQNILDPIPWIVVRQPNRPKRLNAAALALTRAEAKFADTSTDAAGILMSLGVAQLRTGDTAQALETLGRAAELQETKRTAPHPEIQMLMAIAEARTGQKEQAAARLDRAIKSLTPKTPEETASVLAEAALVIGGAAALNDAIQTLIATVGEDCDATRGTIQLAVAHLVAENLLDEAAALNDRFADLVKKYTPDAQSRVATVAQYRGRILLAQGRAPEAEPLLRESLRLRRQIDGLDTATQPIGIFQTLLGVCLERQKKYEEAEKTLVEGLRVFARWISVPAALGRQGIESLVRTYEATGKPERAAEWRERLKQFE